MKSLCNIEECGTKKLLNISGRGSENGDKVLLYAETGEANEKWYVYQSGAIKSYSVKNKALTYIPETNNLIIWDYNVKDLRQHFTFKSLKEGKELIVSKYNGKTLSSIPPRHTNLSFNTFVKDKVGQSFRRTKTLPTLMTDTMGGVINWAVRFGSGSRTKVRTEESYGRWYRLRNNYTKQYVSVIGEDEDRIGMIDEKSKEFNLPLSWWFFHDQHICNSRYRRHCIGYDDSNPAASSVISLCEFNSRDASQIWKLVQKKMFLNEKDKKVLHVNGKEICTFQQQKGSNRFHKLQLWELEGEKNFPSRYFEPIQRAPPTPVPGGGGVQKDGIFRKKDDMDSGFVMVAGEWGNALNLQDDEDEDFDEINAEVMTKVEFDKLIQKMKKSKYSTEMERLLREVAGKDYIRCDQLDEIMKNLLFVEDKIWSVRLFRGRIVDRKNAKMLTKHFDFEDEQMEILKIITRKKKRVAVN